MTVKDKWANALNETLTEKDTEPRKRLVKKPNYKITILFKSGASITGECKDIKVKFTYSGKIENAKIINVHGDVDDSFVYIDWSEVTAIIKEVLND